MSKDLEELINFRFNYDKKNGVLIWKNHLPNFHKLIGKKAGTRHSAGYLNVILNKKVIFVHRIIWFLENNEWIKDPFMIDHINGIKTDNKIENLLEQLLLKEKICGCLNLKQKEKLSF